MRLPLLLLLATGLPLATSAAPLPTGFTYQGELVDSGTPAQGDYDFEFCLFGSVAGPDLIQCLAPLDGVAVQAGVFTVPLDFGAGPFLGEERFLEIRVRRGSDGGAFTSLLPRQALSATPYALHALGIGNDAVGSLQIADGTVTATDLIAGAVSTSRLADGAVTSGKLGADSVGSSHIVDLAVAGDDIANGAITAAKLAPAAVGLAQIDTSQVQARIAGSCAPGEYFRGVAANGAVLCEPLPGTQRISVVEDLAGQDPGEELALAIGLDGLPVIAYREAAQGSLRVAKCGNAACSAGNTITEIESAGDTGKEPTIVVGADGLPRIAYVNAGFDVRYVLCGNPACSSGNGNVLIEGSANQLGAGLSLALGSDGLPIMSYGDRTALSLKFARCTTASCSAGSVTVRELDNPANDVGLDTALAVGNDGFPFIVYRDNTDESVDALRCGSLDCASGNVLTPEIVPSGPIRLDLALLVPPAPATPQVFYRNATANSGLFVLRCGDANCTPAGNVVTAVAHPDGHAMQALSARLGSGGLPLVAYHDAGIGGLALLRCGDRSCASGNHFATVDNSFAQSGLPAALAIGADGLPLIAYHQGTDQSLRVAHCGSVACQ